MQDAPQPPTPPEHFFHRWKTAIFALIFLGLLFLGFGCYSLMTQQLSEKAPIQSSGSTQLSVDVNASGTEASDGFIAVNNVVDDPVFGAEEPLLTIVAFEDFGCPYCQQQQQVLRKIMVEHQDTVRFVYRDFPITALHPQAQKAAEAAQCAHAQNKFWEYHDTLFANQSRHSIDDLKRYASTLGLDTIAFDRCLDDGIYAEEVLQDYQDGLQAGVTGTPTFFFNGQKLAGVITLEGFQEILAYFTQ